MSNIQPYTGTSGVLAPRDSRRVGRGVSRQEVGRALRETQADVETDVAIAKIQNATMATGAGMSAVAQVAQGQQQLELMVPGASARLAFIADGHALGVSDTLQDLRRRMSRI